MDVKHYPVSAQTSGAWLPSEIVSGGVSVNFLMGVGGLQKHYLPPTNEVFSA
jgi:hypothetical protein